MDNQEPEFPSSWLLDPVDMDEIERDWLDQPGPYGYRTPLEIYRVCSW